MGSWVTNTPLPYGAEGIEAVGYNGKIYIVGGKDGSGSGLGLDTTTEYDPGIGYTTLDTLNNSRFYYAMGLYGSTIIVAGGYYSGYTDSVEVYDIDATTPQWTTKTSMPGGNCRCTGAVWGDYFYTFGGNTDNVYKCDINNNFSWTTPISSAGVGVYPTVETVGDFIWVIGGYTDRTAVRKYNPSTNNWVSGSYTVAPLDVSFATSCAHGTKIYIAGGQDEDTFISYDTESDTWDTLTDLPTARYLSAGAKVGDNFYVISGCDTSYNVTNENESYDLSQPPTPPTPPTNPGGDINPYKTRVRG